MITRRTLLSLWMKGYSLSDIADRMGVSRQRIHQLSEDLPPRQWRHPATPVERQLVRDGHLRTSPSGLIRPIHVHSALLRAERAVAGKIRCPGCGGRKAARKAVCDECRPTYQKAMNWAGFATRTKGWPREKAFKVAMRKYFPKEKAS